jgi:hypothetical protein
MILRHLFIPFLKAGVGTVGFYAQAALQKARLVRDAKWPGLYEVGVVFAAHFVYEASLLSCHL